MQKIQQSDSSVMAAILLSSNRDRVKLQEGGYLYVFDKLSTNGEKKFWRCERKSECNARIHTDAVTNVVVKRASEHNHPSNVEITSSGSVLSGPKRRAYEPIEDLSQLDNLQMRFSRDSHHFNHSLATDALQKMIQRKKMRTNTNDEIGSPSHTSSNNGYANEGISVEEVMAQSDDGQTNPNTSQSSHFLSGTMAVKEEGLSRTQQQQQNNLRDRSAIAAELICERAPEIAATSTASITASAAASSTLPTVAAVRPKRSTAQINVIPIGVDKYLMGGFVCWSQKIALIVEDSELVARMVCNSDRKQFASILFTGAPNTGKSCLAAIATKCVESTMVRVCSGDDMIALTDVAKVTALRKVLEDTYSNTVNVVLLDNVDRLIGASHSSQENTSTESSFVDHSNCK
uniref:Vesicle-fusing ATPase n=1 Tax=Parascaris univalens TaxID=6257 RepID=A0A915AW64_PARUN